MKKDKAFITPKHGLSKQISYMDGIEPFAHIVGHFLDSQLPNGHPRKLGRLYQDFRAAHPDVTIPGKDQPKVFRGTAEYCGFKVSRTSNNAPWYVRRRKRKSPYSNEFGPVADTYGEPLEDPDWEELDAQLSDRIHDKLDVLVTRSMWQPRDPIYNKIKAAIPNVGDKLISRLINERVRYSLRRKWLKDRQVFQLQIRKLPQYTGRDKTEGKYFKNGKLFVDFGEGSPD